MKNIYRCWSWSILLGLLACFSPALSEENKNYTFSHISGKIIDADTHKPIFGAFVELLIEGQAVGGLTTDHDGSFFFDELHPGKKQIIVHLVGYQSFYKEVLVGSGIKSTYEINLVREPITMQAVEILGKSEQVNSKITGTASKISADLVTQTQPLGIQELLELVPGINGYADDGFGNSRLSIGIRGLNPRRSSRVLLLEDGIPIQPAVYVYPNAYYNPPAERIIGVEIVKGSGAVRFGPQTMGGVVNYLTQRPTGDRRLSNRLTIGAHNYRSVFSELLGLGNEKYKSDFQLLYKHGDGFRDNNAFDQLNGTVKLQVKITKDKNFYLKINSNYENTNATYTGLTEYSFRTSPTYNPKKHDNFKVKRTSADLIYTNRIRPNIVAETLAYISFFDRRWWREDDIFIRASSLDSGDLTPVAYYQTGDLVRVGNGASNFGILRTFYVGGIQQEYSLKHQFLGYPATTRVSGRVYWEHFVDDRKIGNAPDARTGVYYTGTPGQASDPVQILGQSHHYETTALALYAHQQIRMGNLSFSPGVRFEVFEQERVDRLRGSVLADKVSAVILPGIGINYALGLFNFFGGIHRGYTPPSSGTLKITQFGQNSATDGLDLKAEKSWNIEAGLRVWRPGLTLEASVFNIRIQNLVAAARGTAFQNLGSASNLGLELGLASETSKFSYLLPDLNLSYTYLKTRVTKGITKSAIYAGNVSVNLKGNELPYAPHHTLMVGLSKKCGRIQCRTDLHYIDKVYTDFENIERTYNRGDTGLIQAHNIINISLKYKISTQWTAFLTAKNLLDNIYIGSRLHSNAGQPKANVSSGIIVGPRRQINFGIKHEL